MLANSLLVILLLHTILAQTTGDSFKDQPPVKVEILDQVGSPLSITLTGVDNSVAESQTVNFTVQNTSSKNIKAYVLFYSDESGAGGTSIRFFSSLVPELIVQDSFSIARANIKFKEKLFLSVDHIEFGNHDSWGKDTQKQAEYISACYEGESYAIKLAAQILLDKNENNLAEFLKNENRTLDTSQYGDKKSAKWQNGFSSGYASVLRRLRDAYQKQGMEGVILKYEEIEKLTKEGGK
jgi:hypothetical protein